VSDFNEYMITYITKEKNRARFVLHASNLREALDSADQILERVVHYGIIAVKQEGLNR
jgi:hypothetical protein